MFLSLDSEEQEHAVELTPTGEDLSDKDPLIFDFENTEDMGLFVSMC